VSDSCGTEITFDVRSAGENWIEKTPDKITVENLTGPNCGDIAWTDNWHVTVDNTTAWKVSAGAGVSCDRDPITATWVVPSGYAEPSLNPNQFATGVNQADQNDCDDPGDCHPYTNGLTQYYWGCAP
jgi:hypothetical protein